jgi:hypothetical protein
MGYFMRNGPTLEAIRNGCYEALKISETNSYLPEIKNGEHPKEAKKKNNIQDMERHLKEIRANQRMLGILPPKKVRKNH